MKSVQRWTVGVLVVTMIAVFGACKSAPPPEPLSKPAPVPTPVPTPRVQEEVVEQPITETIVSEEVTEEIPRDLEALNAKGYLEDSFFETDSWDLRPEFRETLAKNAAWLQQYPSVKVLVEGHCDERNTREYNLALGERRANVVRDYLVFLGISPQRIRTISYGEERPFAIGSNEEAWRLNRRAHFVITAR
jgi:peptidoglycan-associated lipoprotein